jgi:putative sterol carrier protein
METPINLAIRLLRERLIKGFDHKIKIHIINEGSIVVDHTGVRQSNEKTECTVIASAKTFKSLLTGKTKINRALMSKKLCIKGSISVAIELGNSLS